MGLTITPKQRENILKGVLGLVVGVLMIWVGYYLNGYLSREVLTVEVVEVSTYYQKLGLPRKEWQSLLRSEAFQYYALGLTSNDADLITRETPDVWPNQVESIRTIIEEFAASHKEVSDRVQAIISQTNEPTEAEIADLETYLFGHRYMLDSMLPRQWEFVKKPTIELRDRLADLTSKIEILTDAIDDYRPKVVTDIEVRVLLLNSGDTDGLVRPKGTLVVGGKDRLPIAGSATRIAKRSMEEMSLWVEMRMSAPAAIQRIESDIKQGLRTPIQVELTDVNGEVLPSTRGFELPMADDGA